MLEGKANTLVKLGQCCAVELRKLGALWEADRNFQETGMPMTNRKVDESPRNRCIVLLYMLEIRPLSVPTDLVHANSTNLGRRPPVYSCILAKNVQMVASAMLGNGYQSHPQTKMMLARAVCGLYQGVPMFRFTS